MEPPPPVPGAAPIAAFYHPQGDAEAAAISATTATDNCPGPLVKAVSTSGTCSAVITVTVTDGCGNSASVTYNTPIDNTPPVPVAGTIPPCYHTQPHAEPAPLPP